MLKTKVHVYVTYCTDDVIIGYDVIDKVCTRGLVWRAIIDNEGSLRIVSETWHRKLTMSHTIMTSL